MAKNFNRRGRPSEEEVRQELEDAIILLRQNGVKLREMADDLGIPLGTLGGIATRLIKQGRMESKWRNRSSAPDAQATQRLTCRERMAERNRQIIGLVGSGLCLSDIAEYLGVTYSCAYQATRQLVLSGLVAKPRRKPYAWQDAHGRSFEERNRQRIPTIIAMTKERATLDEIGAELSITRERVRQLRQRIVCLYGEEVLEEEKLYRASEAAKLTGRSSIFVTSLMKRDRLPFVRRGGKRKERRLTEDGLKQLREWQPRQRTERVCAVCGKTFTAYSATACSEQCRGRRSYLHQSQWRPENSCGWAGAAWQALQSHPLTESEIWIEVSYARKQSGLSRIQLQYLRQTRIVATRDHPTKRWRGKPQQTYAASQMEIVRRVYEEFKNKQPAAVEAAAQ